MNFQLGTLFCEVIVVCCSQLSRLRFAENVGLSALFCKRTMAYLHEDAFCAFQTLMQVATIVKEFAVSCSSCVATIDAVMNAIFRVYIMHAKCGTDDRIGMARLYSQHQTLCSSVGQGIIF